MPLAEKEERHIKAAKKHGCIKTCDAGLPGCQRAKRPGGALPPTPGTREGTGCLRPRSRARRGRSRKPSWCVPALSQRPSPQPTLSWEVVLGTCISASCVCTFQPLFEAGAVSVLHIPPLARGLERTDGTSPLASHCSRGLRCRPLPSGSACLLPSRAQGSAALSPFGSGRLLPERDDPCLPVPSSTQGAGSLIPTPAVLSLRQPSSA